MDLSDLFRNFIEQIIGLGYVGIFLISLIASSIPFLPLPYLILVVLTASQYDYLDLFIYCLMAGLGGSIGKLTTYYLGRTTNLALSEEKKKQLEFFRKITRKYGTIGVFIFAITPLPDDILYFPLGVGKFDFKRFFFANMLGKILLVMIVGFLSKTYYNIAKDIAGESLNFQVTIIAIIFAIILTILLLKINWYNTYTILEKEGVKGLVKNFRKVFNR
jgi:membrane protein DedA with SNARE-associated domain